MGTLLERWQLDEAEVRRRMYRAPTPREREPWHAVWLLAQGWTATAVGRALDRDAHTIGQWATAFMEGGPTALSFEQSGGSPRAERGAAGRVEGGGAGSSQPGGDRTIQLELEGGAPVCARTVRVGAEPEQLPELPAPAGVCAEASEEAVAQGRPGTAGSLCGGVCRPCRSGPTQWGQDILHRRGALSGGR